jgi:hypothetical protein
MMAAPTTFAFCADNDVPFETQAATVNFENDNSDYDAKTLE